jgi:hypothetical protein
MTTVLYICGGVLAASAFSLVLLWTMVGVRGLFDILRVFRNIVRGKLWPSPHEVDEYVVVVPSAGAEQYFFMEDGVLKIISGEELRERLGQKVGPERMEQMFGNPKVN